MAEEVKKKKSTKKAAVSKTDKLKKTTKKAAAKVETKVDIKDKDVASSKKKAVSEKTTSTKKSSKAIADVEATKSKLPAKKSIDRKTINKNKTTFLKQSEIKRNWLVLDSAGKPLGRVAALAASLLRGKHKVDFTPNVDCGDGVIIINCKDAILTGKKLEQKIKYHHSGWIGGLKETKYSELMKKNPQKAMYMAVSGMLAHNSLSAKMLKHLKTYKDEKHGHEAQKPQLYDF